MAIAILAVSNYNQRLLAIATVVTENMEFVDFPYLHDITVTLGRSSRYSNVTGGELAPVNHSTVGSKGMMAGTLAKYNRRPTIFQLVIVILIFQ